MHLFSGAVYPNGAPARLLYDRKGVSFEWWFAIGPGSGCATPAADPITAMHKETCLVLSAQFACAPINEGAGIRRPRRTGEEERRVPSECVAASMRHITREEAMIADLLRATRIIAVVGASPRSARHSHAAVSYLHRAGFEVVPVRPDRAAVSGLPTFASLDDFGGSVDIVVIFRRPDAVVAHILQGAAKRAYAVWLPPGAWSREAEEAARTHNLTLIKNRCIIEEHQHLTGAMGEPTSGHPRKHGAHARRRSRRNQEQVSAPESGYVEGGGGGHKAGGGKHSVLDEKKMRSGHRKRG